MESKRALETLTVRQILRGDDASRFDSWVEARATAPTDLPAWRQIVRDAYGTTSHAFAAFDGDRIRGALTLFEASHPLFGHYLATGAFGNDGGFHVDGAGARDALQNEAIALGERLRVDYVLFRLRDEDLPGLNIDRHYRTAVIDLAGGAEAVWSSILPAKTRNQIRKGMKEGFTVRSGPGEMGAFFDVFTTHMRELGSPAHSTRFYESVLEHLGPSAEFVVVGDGRRTAAGALLFRVNGVATNYHTVALREFNPRCPNYLIYWTMIESSCERGCRLFDMGRSEDGSPNLKFKMNWGPAVIPLSYNYSLRTLRETPYLDPRNPRYRIPIALWQKTPLFVTRRLGPRLISGLL